MKAEPLNQLLSTIKNLEPLPQVAMRVLKLSRAEEVIPRDLAQVIQSDPALTAKVLKLCNSAYYGFHREIASIQDAANLLGTAKLTNLVLTSCSGQYFHAMSSSASDHQRLWQRSVCNALAAARLAKLHGSVDPNRAYTAGLLQDIGLFLFTSFFRDEHQQVIDAVNAGSDPIEAETHVHGLDHAEIGARLLDQWDFPEILVDSIRHHHGPMNDCVDRELTRIIGLSERITDAIDKQQGLYALSDELAGFSLDLEGLGGLSVSELETLLRHELEQARDLISV